MAATKQEINGILLRIAAKYVTDFALWSDCAGRTGRLTPLRLCGEFPEIAVSGGLRTIGVQRAQ